MLTSNKTAVFLTTRHFIPIFNFKINKTNVKDDLTITPSIIYTCSHEMGPTYIGQLLKNEHVLYLCFITYLLDKYVYDIFGKFQHSTTIITEMTVTTAMCAHLQIVISVTYI